MTPDEQHVFVNALRECLGLGPLYDRMLIDGREYESRPDRYINFSHFIGDGNRHVRGRPSAYSVAHAGVKQDFKRCVKPG